MIKLVEKIEQDNNLIKGFEYKKLYELIEDGKNVGIAIITKDIENMIYIYTPKNIRGNGYGKLLFSELLKIMKLDGYKEIKTEFSKRNVKMQNIVIKNGGLHLYTTSKRISYIIPIK